VPEGEEDPRARSGLGIGFWIGMIFDAPFILLLIGRPYSDIILYFVSWLGWLLGLVTLVVGVPLSILDIKRGRRFCQPRLVSGGTMGVLLCGWLVLFWMICGPNGTGR
jgi:hypothetical protein